MSVIYFHSEKDGTVTVRGNERAHFAGAIGRLAWSEMSSIAYDLRQRPSPLRRAFDSAHYLHTAPDFERGVETVIRNGFEGLMLEGKPVQILDLHLNTAMVLGSDILKFAARMHGQCEIHAYVEGKNRAWLAGIIERGRQSGFLRPEMGWEGVVELLRKGDGGPVVTSHSVTAQFPNREVAGWGEASEEDDEAEEWWETLPEDEQWALALAGLRSEEWGDVEMKPETWDGYLFGGEMNACQFVERLLASVGRKDD